MENFQSKADAASEQATAPWAIDDTTLAGQILYYGQLMMHAEYYRETHAELDMLLRGAQDGRWEEIVLRLGQDPALRTG